MSPLVASPPRQPVVGATQRSQRATEVDSFDHAVSDHCRRGSQPPALPGDFFSLEPCWLLDSIVIPRAKRCATELRPVADQFYGDRMGTFKDPFGHVWSIATHVEDLSPEDMQKRQAAAGAN